MTTAETKRREGGEGGGCCLDYLQASAGSGKGVTRAMEASAQRNAQFGVRETRGKHPLTQGHAFYNHWVSPTQYRAAFALESFWKINTVEQHKIK